MLLFVFHVLGPEAEARNGRAEIVCDGRNHLRPVFNEPTDTFLHLVHRVSGLADFQETRLWQRRSSHVRAQSFCRMGERG